MRGWFVASVGICALIGSPPAIAEEKPTSITFVSGTCEALRIPGSDLTRRCLPQLTKIAEPGGGTNFMAMAGDDRAVLLRAGPAAGRDPATFPLSSIAVVNQQTTIGEDHEVTGWCREVRSAGSAGRIDCNATDRDGGRYDLRFASDGHPPTTTRF